MAVVHLNRENLSYYRNRIEKLTEQSPRKWGTMTSSDMMAHLRLLLDMSLEIGTYADVSNIFTRTVVKFMVLHVLPMPKGIKVPAEFVPPSKEKFQDERRLLLEKLEMFIKELEKTPERVSRQVAFGPLSFTQWGKLHGKHFDHHLRQFGV